ncbi:MAG: hypothetical protein IAX22_03795 [Candidatus Bathyarchaeota archaeon]|nr:hypothetical protein [Candidatus Bathyarchaeota archaeon]
MAKKKTLFVLALLVALLTVAAAIFISAQLDSGLFVFSLSTYPKNATVLAAQNLTIRVDVAYIKGAAELLTLSATGGPNGTLFQFSKKTGTLNATQPLSSYLTISVPTSAASGSYPIDVCSNSSSQTGNAKFNLTVLASEIPVSGAVTILSQVTVKGVTIDVIPTDILFKNNATGQVYQTKISRFSDTNVAPGKTGNYTISLPNQQSYDVGFYCFSFPHYIPIYRAATSGVENGVYTVDCGLDVTSLSANFTG